MVASPEDAKESKTEGAKKPEIERVQFANGATLFQKVDKLVSISPGKLHRLDVHLRTVDLIRACGKLGTRKGMEHARKLLDRVLLEKRHVNELMIASKTFDTVIFGWVKMSAPESYEKMREILALMESEYEYDQSTGRLSIDAVEEEFEGKEKEELAEIRSRDSAQPTLNTFNTILRGLSEMVKHDPNVAATNAERLLEEMMSHHLSQGWYTKPNTKSYLYVILAHGNTNNQNGRRARDLLNRIKRLHEDEKERYVMTYGFEYDIAKPQNNVEKIITADAHIYAAVISAFAKSSAPGSADEAYELLLELLDSGMKPDCAVFNATIHAFAQKARSNASRKARLDAARKAEDILWNLVEMLDEQRRNDSDKISEDDIGDEEEGDNQELSSSDKDEDKRLRKQLTIVFNTAINAWARSDAIEAGDRAEELLHKMLNSDLAVPDKITINSVLNAWSRQPNPQKAEALLDVMYEMYLSGQLDDTAKPDNQSYSTVMYAWARSKEADKTQQARRLFDVMISKYGAGEADLKPNVVAFTTILNAACTSPLYQVGTGGSDDDAFGVEADVGGVYAISMQTYNELLNDTFNLGVYVDHIVFSAMLKVVARHTLETSVERRLEVERIFDDACQRGHVSSMVIKELRKACPDRGLLERLLRSRKLAESMATIRQLPKEWTKRVPNQPRYRVVDAEKSKSKDRKSVV